MTVVSLLIFCDINPIKYPLWWFWIKEPSHVFFKLFLPVEHRSWNIGYFCSVFCTFNMQCRTLNPHSTPLNNEPVPQVLKQVVHLSCFHWYLCRNRYTMCRVWKYYEKYTNKKQLKFLYLTSSNWRSSGTCNNAYYI